MENMDKGLTNKLGADILAENLPNAPEFIYPICLPQDAQAQKFWISMKKKFHWVSIVRDQEC